jgi:sec-independent protein translocase protein TatA
VADDDRRATQMPNLGGPELIIILAVFVLLFGAKKLPELGSSFGKSIKNFKRGIEDANAEADDDTDEHAESDDEPVSKTTK